VRGVDRSPPNRPTDLRFIAIFGRARWGASMSRQVPTGFDRAAATMLRRER
jgi:hypothetical protein